jgi:calcium-dependent protein kinase
VRTGKFDYPSPDWDNTSAEAKDFIGKMLTRQEDKRPSAQEMLEHPWLKVSEASRHVAKMQSTFVDKLRRFQGEKKLKKVVLTLIAEQLEDKELQQLKDTFQELDANHDGSLSILEIKTGLEKHGIQIPADLDNIISALDTDGSGNIDYTEFIAASMEQKQYSQKAVLWAAFRRFDTDGNGRIDAKEMAAMIHDDASFKVARELIKEADVDGDGEVSFDEFCKIMGTS